ncbi:hypothetical protein Scep_026894 [Stephania cephalantha]|uniref:Gnk2-homologous domain-containing protein n=1 Tax=Stephania cephalantha TaxID=152367 RepID=A0AAP0EL06_9MAGN
MGCQVGCYIPSIDLGQFGWSLFNNAKGISLRYSDATGRLKLKSMLKQHECQTANQIVVPHLFIYSGCSPNKYQPNSPYETNLNSVLTSISTSSSQSSYNSFGVGNGTSTPPPDSAAYGLYQCRGDLKITDCSACIQSGLSQIGLVCPDSYGARIQLDGCLIRYENSNFLGKLDTTLVFKKCSQSTSNDVEFYRRRDDVLADLQGAASFRVSSSGLVEGFAQCLGDLSQADCTSCLADAVGKLKYVCGSAAAVDVYLAQCYARYWAAGYYESG